MAMNVSKIYRPRSSRLVGFSFVFFAILLLRLLLGGQTIFETQALLVLKEIAIYFIIAAAISFHYTIIPLKYNGKIFLIIGALAGIFTPVLLGGYAIFLAPFTVPIFAIIATLGPKAQDSLDRLSKRVHHLLLLPFIMILLLFVFNAIRYLVINGYFAIN